MEKYDGLPVLYTHDYSEINDAYLNEKYNEMLEKTRFKIIFKLL